MPKLSLPSSIRSLAFQRESKSYSGIYKAEVDHTAFARPSQAGIYVGSKYCCLAVTSPVGRSYSWRGLFSFGFSFAEISRYLRLEAHPVPHGTSSRRSTKSPHGQTERNGTEREKRK